MSNVETVSESSHRRSDAIKTDLAAAHEAVERALAGEGQRYLHDEKPFKDALAQRFALERELAAASEQERIDAESQRWQERQATALEVEAARGALREREEQELLMAAAIVADEDRLADAQRTLESFCAETDIICREAAKVAAVAEVEPVSAVHLLDNRAIRRVRQARAAKREAAR